MRTLLPDLIPAAEKKGQDALHVRFGRSWAEFHCYVSDRHPENHDYIYELKAESNDVRDLEL